MYIDFCKEFIEVFIDSHRVHIFISAVLLLRILLKQKSNPLLAQLLLLCLAGALDLFLPFQCLEPL